MYTLYTRDLYKVWFSSNPDVFMNLENQLRIAKARNENKKANISLIYSSELLSEKSIFELKDFCKILNITPVDFDIDVKALLETKNDKEIFGAIKEELFDWVWLRGGNVGVASDMIRLMRCVIENYGIYSDLDLKVKFDTLPNEHQVKRPFIFPIDILDDGKNFAKSNDIVCFATRNNSGKRVLDSDALKKLELMQESLIKLIRDVSIEEVIEYTESQNNFSNDIQGMIKKINNTYINGEFSIKKYRLGIERFGIDDALYSLIRIIEIPFLRMMMEESAVSLSFSEKVAFCANIIKQSQKQQANQSDQALVFSAIDKTRNMLLKYCVLLTSGSNCFSAGYAITVEERKKFNLLTEEEALEFFKGYSILSNGLSANVIGGSAYVNGAEDNDMSWTIEGVSKIKEKEAANRSTWVKQLEEEKAKCVAESKFV